MIHVERSREAPRVLDSPRFAAMREQIAAHFRRPPEERAQVTFEWPYLSPGELLAEVLEQFHGKCAFCESKLEGSFGIDRFRPRRDALSLSGDAHPDRYWWLVLEWGNLYAVCAECNRFKGSRFPVAGERVVPTAADAAALAAERPLLLDPCAADDPARHLVFAADGLVAAVPWESLPAAEQRAFGRPTRGQVTIDTFSLNRPELVLRRQRAAEAFRRTLEVEDWEAVGEALSAPAPFLALKRSLLEEAGFAAGHEAVDGRPGPGAPGPPTPSVIGEPAIPRDGLGEPGPTDGAPAAAPAPGAPARPRFDADRAFTAQVAREVIFSATSVEADEDVASYFARTTYVERVEIEAVSTMRDFACDLTGGGTGGEGAVTASSGDAPWLMLLGENGVGKTSVLKAVALALAGPRRLDSLAASPRAAEVVSMFRPGGRVRVYLSSQVEPLELRREGDRLVHSGDSLGAKVILRAMGPSRWFPHPGSKEVESDDFVRVANLFDPFCPLARSDAFLLSLDERRWQEVARGLKELLGLAAGGIFERRPGDGGAPSVVLSDAGGRERTLGQLSSGYEAILAMACDLASLLFQRWDGLRTAEGIMLLDEIGAHLHPRWKMHIVDGLRTMFPRVQFLATTHEPLCLRGLRRGEIVVMSRQPGADGAPAEVVPLRPSEDVSELRVDQILTSRIFGLQAALDPRLERRMERYYDLLSRHESSLSSDEEEELARLRREVGGSGVLGSGRRAQAIYRLVDGMLAREDALPGEEDRREAERWTREKVADLWARLPVGGDRGAGRSDGGPAGGGTAGGGTAGGRGEDA